MENIDVLINLRSLLGEGPVWDHRTEQLAWVDILGQLVHLTDPDTGITTSVPVGTPVGALGLLGDSDYLLAVRNGFAPLVDGRVGAVEEAFASMDVRMNDGSSDPAGRFLAGSMSNDLSSAIGTLYIRDGHRTIRPLIRDVTISNGLAWSLDGNVMYYVDSALHRIDVLNYDLEAGAVSGRRPWVDISPEDGTPDGITVDAEGCVWVALWGGSSVRRYSPDGALVGQIQFPVQRISSCAFGGAALDRLFVTSARVGSPPGQEPSDLDGAVFVADPGCRGLPTPVVAELP